MSAPKVFRVAVSLLEPVPQVLLVAREHGLRRDEKLNAGRPRRNEYINLLRVRTAHHMRFGRQRLASARGTEALLDLRAKFLREAILNEVPKIPRHDSWRRAAGPHLVCVEAGTPQFLCSPHVCRSGDDTRLLRGSYRHVKEPSEQFEVRPVRPVRLPGVGPWLHRKKMVEPIELARLHHYRLPNESNSLKSAGRP